MSFAISTRKATIPGPRPKPLIGPMGNVRAFARDPVGSIEQLFRQYGNIRLFSATVSEPQFVY